MGDACHLNDGIDLETTNKTIEWKAIVTAPCRSPPPSPVSSLLFKAADQSVVSPGEN